MIPNNKKTIKLILCDLNELAQHINYQLNKFEVYEYLDQPDINVVCYRLLKSSDFNKVNNNKGLGGFFSSKGIRRNQYWWSRRESNADLEFRRLT